jgi:hypothetical protein
MTEKPSFIFKVSYFLSISYFFLTDFGFLFSAPGGSLDGRWRDPGCSLACFFNPGFFFFKVLSWV